MCVAVNICKIHSLLCFIPYLCVFDVVVFLCFQGEPHGARCDHEEAAGGGLEDETEVPAGDGEKLPWTGGGAGEEGKPQLTPSACYVMLLERMTEKMWILFLRGDQKVRKFISRNLDDENLT